MPAKKLLKYSFLDSLGAIIYIILIATFISNANKLFGNPPDSPFIAIAMLSLFVFSAAVMGGLVLGRPVVWFLNGNKDESIKLFIYTLGWLFLFTVIAFTILAALPKHVIVY